MTVLVLDHERLEVYRVARELSREICRVRKKMSGGRADLIDQILRATASIPFNIAEGNGEVTRGRRAYFFRIARSSATELSAALDHTVDMEMLADADVIAAKTLIVRVVSMLIKLTDKVTTPDSLPPLPKRRSPRKR
jgi:four helix bundle protein